MIGDYEDDTHFCLKCHATIIGLDHYVTHRKSGCSKTVVDLPKSPLPSQLLPPDDSFNLKADDFFSSLELQSSTKKTTPPPLAKNISGILTRSKTTAAIQANSSQKETQEIPQSKTGKNVWIGGHQLKLGSGDNQSKLITALDNLERRKEEPPKIEVFEESDLESEEYDYDVDESSEDENHDAPPRNYTGGKWKPSSPIQWNRQDWNDPPPSYTGGKWKPQAKRTSPPPSHTKGTLSPKESDNNFPPPTFTGSKWSQSKAKQDYDEPPSTHTKGKWKPDDNPNEDESFKYKKKKDSDHAIPPQHTSGKWKPPTPDVPSPNYTKGKWIPTDQTKKTSARISDDSPFRKSSGTVQYWCRTCNRRLASKIVYERHLKSELHFKRTLRDKELEDNIGIVTEKRTKKKTADGSVENKTENSESPKRKRKKIFTKCQVCNSKVNKNLMGKHLISHYHCRKGDITTSEAQNMVLDHIFEIILQSPFQCAACKFYFNHQKDFLQHWLSDYHSATAMSHSGYFWCSLCKFKTEDTAIMYDHLISQEHKEVVSVINRSVPIIIKRITPITCEECGEEFLLNTALLRHCLSKGHKSENFVSNPKNCICSICRRFFRSNVSLKRHKERAHGNVVFICTACNMNFFTKEEAKAHRNTREHRYKVTSKTNVVERKCEYCSEIFRSLPDLKDHLNAKHGEFKSKCGHCGATFTLPQELSVHLRTKSCSFTTTKNSENSCGQCPFSSDSPSELLFHKALHAPPLMITPSEHESRKKKPEAQYKCPLCDKFFVKSSLHPHLRFHTKERPFVCPICSKGFVRKNNWALHVRNHDRNSEKKEKRKEIADTLGNRPFLCSTCGARFRKKSILQQHMTTHSGKIHKCTKAGCVFVGRNVSDLRQHFTTHNEEKNFACTFCDYRGKSRKVLKSHMLVHVECRKFYSCTECSFTCKTTAHLKRHARQHTGAKPYTCPHCFFRSRNLENLRKHILRVHVGKYIYECKYCDEGLIYKTDFANEFRAHLTSHHSTDCTSDRKALTCVAGLYDVLEDRTELPESGTNADSNDPSAKAKIIVVQEVTDPVVTEAIAKEAVDEANSDEIFPMFIVQKEAVPVDNLEESWNEAGNYDVDESGALVPFNGDNVFFQGHF